MAVTRSITSVATKLPHGWRQIRARNINNTAYVKFYISPTGKRFSSLKDAIRFIMEEVRTNAGEMSKKVGKRISKEEVEQKKRAQAEMFEQRAKQIQELRKIKSVKSPFRNMLKNVLKRSHKRYMNSTT